MGAAASGSIGNPSDLWQCGTQENCCAAAAERGYAVVDVCTEQEPGYDHIVESYSSGKEATHEGGKVDNPHAVSSMGQYPEAYPSHLSRAALPVVEMVQPMVPHGGMYALPSFEAHQNYAGFRVGMNGAPRREFPTEHFSVRMPAPARARSVPRSVPQSASQGRAEHRASSCGRPQQPMQPTRQASCQPPWGRPAASGPSPARDSLLTPPPGASRGRAARNGLEAPPGVGGSATFSVGGGSATFGVGDGSSRGRSTSLDRCSPSDLHQHAAAAQMQGLPHPPLPQVPFPPAAESGTRGSAGMSNYLGNLVQTFMSGLPAARSERTSIDKKIKELPEEVAVNCRRQDQPEAEPELEHLAQESAKPLSAAHQQTLTPRQLSLSASRQRCPSFTSFGADELMQPGSSLVALPGGIVEAGLFKQKSFLESSCQDSLGTSVESGKVQQLLDTKNWSNRCGKDENYSPQQVHRGLRHAWAGDMAMQDAAGRSPLTSTSGPTSPLMGTRGSPSHGCSRNSPYGVAASSQAAAGLPLVMHVD